MSIDQVIAVLHSVYRFTIGDGHQGTELLSGAGENRGCQSISPIVRA